MRYSYTERLIEGDRSLHKWERRGMKALLASATILSISSIADFLHFYPFGSVPNLVITGLGLLGTAGFGIGIFGIHSAQRQIDYQLDQRGLTPIRFQTPQKRRLTIVK